MSRGIVVGFSYYLGAERVERVIAAPDAKSREAVDKLVKAAPDFIQKQVAKFLAPLLENNEPAAAGKYDHAPFDHHPSDHVHFWVWWKRCFVEES